LGTVPETSFDYNGIAMHNVVTNYMHFMWAALLKLRQTGAIIPSQRFLIEKMIAPVPVAYSGQIIELGAGNGALTLRLAARCPEARILACEINPALVQVIPDSAEHLLSEMGRRGMGKADFVLSGIPLGNLPGDRVLALIDAINQALVPGGMYIQFQYSLLDRKRIRTRFQTLHTATAFLNIPPAVVYYAQK
jgi:phospholipid N-methyltransferase